MTDPRAYRIDPETLRDEPEDVAAMRQALAELKGSAGGDRAAEARRLGEAGNLARLLGDLAQAEALLQRAIDLVPASEPILPFTLRIRRATVWHWQGRYDEADREFAQLQQQAPPQLRSYVLQHAGKSLFDQQRFGEAHAMFSAALALREATGEDGPLESTRLALRRVERALRGRM